MKKKNLNPISKIKFRWFMVLINGSIEFQECKIFNNVYHFMIMLNEYKVKHGFKLNKKKIKRRKCLYVVQAVATRGGFMLLCYMVVKLLWLRLR